MKETITRIYEWLELSGATFGDKSKINMSLDLVNEEVAEFMDGNRTNDNKEILDGFIDTVWVMCNNTYFRGIPAFMVIEMFEKVDESNYSKFCKTEQEAKDTVEQYGKGLHWDKFGHVISAQYFEVNNYFVVKRVEDGKVLKSINYKKV